MSPDSPAARFLGWDGWPTVAVVAVVVAAVLTVALVVRVVRRLRARFRRGPFEVVVIQTHCSDGWHVDLPWEVEVHRVENGRLVGYRHVPASTSAGAAPAVRPTASPTARASAAAPDARGGRCGR